MRSLLIIRLTFVLFLPNICLSNICDYYYQYPNRYRSQKTLAAQGMLPLTDVHAILLSESSLEAFSAPRGSFFQKPKSTAYGYAQVVDGTWQDFTEGHPENWLFRVNFYDSVAFIQWYRMAHGHLLRSTRLYDYYLLYHDGPKHYIARSFKSQKLAQKVEHLAMDMRRDFSRCEAKVQWKANWHAF